jgi:molybdopterin-guanine dinucleotide biosynthesis protein A
MEALLASGRDTQYLIVPCDLPRITADLLRLLVSGDHVLEAHATVFWVEGEPGPEPLPLRLSAAALPAVQSLLDAGRSAVHELLQELEEVEIIDLPRRDAEGLRNVNTRTELEALSRGGGP